MDILEKKHVWHFTKLHLPPYPYILVIWTIWLILLDNAMAKVQFLHIRIIVLKRPELFNICETAKDHHYVNFNSNANFNSNSMD